jgi:D-proline reductase (dithiol) PrdB
LNHQVDSEKYLDFATQQMVRSWVKLGSPVNIPWTAFDQPLSNCKVSLLSTAGIALIKDEPFDILSELENPWWGDPSYRKIPLETTHKDIRIWHQHIKTDYALEDLNCILPLQRLRECAEQGYIGQAASMHYSTMGYILDPSELLNRTVPEIIQNLKAERVDLLVLVPV